MPSSKTHITEMEENFSEMECELPSCGDQIWDDTLVGLKDSKGSKWKINDICPKGMTESWLQLRPGIQIWLKNRKLKARQTVWAIF